MIFRTKSEVFSNLLTKNIGGVRGKHPALFRELSIILRLTMLTNVRWFTFIYQVSGFNWHPRHMITTPRSVSTMLILASTGISNMEEIKKSYRI